MKCLRHLAACISLGSALLAFAGCESTSMHPTPAGKNVQVEAVPEEGTPRVSPVYLTPY